MTEIKVPSSIQHHETVRKWLRENVMKGIIDEDKAEEIYQKWLERKRKMTGRPG